MTEHSMNRPHIFDPFEFLGMRRPAAAELVAKAAPEPLQPANGAPFDLGPPQPAGLIQAAREAPRPANGAPFDLEPAEPAGLIEAAPEAPQPALAAPEVPEPVDALAELFGGPKFERQALEYAGLGWHVFPAPASGEKKSRLAARYSNGAKWGASCDPETVTRNFRDFPASNIGIVTGRISGIFVVEVDTLDGHKVDGLASLAELEGAYGKLPVTFTTRSPSGSIHYYFKWPGFFVKNSTSKLGKGIDVRGDGGMVIAPPSERPGKGEYRIIDPSPVAQTPQWLLDAVRANPTEAKFLERMERQERVATRGPVKIPEWFEAACGALKNENLDWEEWNARGMAIYAACNGADIGEQPFHEFSAKSDKYEPDETDARWSHYKTSPPNQMTEGKLHFYADQDCPGWRRAHEIGGKFYEELPDPEEPAQPESDKQGPPQHIEELLNRPGLVGAIMRFILASSPRPQPELALSAALTILSAAIGRERHSPTDATLSLYALMIGKTGQGKDKQLEAVDKILRATDMSTRLFVGSFKSEIAIYEHMRDHGVTLNVVDEMGDVVKATNSRNASQHSLMLMATLRQMWDGRTLNAPRARTRKPPTFEVFSPRLSMLCASTPAQFYNAIGLAEVLNGFLNRFLVFMGRDIKDADEPQSDICDVPQHITDALKRVAISVIGNAAAAEEMFKGPPKVQWADSSVQKKWKEYERKNLEQMDSDPQRETLGPRLAHNAIKIATLIAIGENPEAPQVTFDHVRISIEIVERSYAAMAAGYDENEPETPEYAAREKIIARIRATGGSMERRALVRTLQRVFRKTRDFDAAIEMLIEAGRIELVADKSAKTGRTLAIYRLLGKG